MAGAYGNLSAAVLLLFSGQKSEQQRKHSIIVEFALPSGAFFCLRRSHPNQLLSLVGPGCWTNQQNAMFFCATTTRNKNERFAIWYTIFNFCLHRESLSSCLSPPLSLMENNCIGEPCRTSCLPELRRPKALSYRGHVAPSGSLTVGRSTRTRTNPIHRAQRSCSLCVLQQFYLFFIYILPRRCCPIQH